MNNNDFVDQIYTAKLVINTIPYNAIQKTIIQVLLLGRVNSFDNTEAFCYIESQQ